MNDQPPDRYVERRIAGLVLSAMEEARVVALLGARQVGKSTLARILATDSLGAEYLTLDDEPTRSLAVEDPVGFISGLSTPTVIDEIQRAPDLMLAIKARVDRDEARGQFLITGSADLRSLPTISDALPGRVDYLTLWPFTQGEIAARSETLLEHLFDSQAPQLSGEPVGRLAHVERLLAGGYPEALRRSEGARTRFFAGYLASILQREVVETSRLHQPGAVADLLRLVAVRSGSIARYQTMGSELGIDGKTVKRYTDVLERLFLIRVRRAWHVNLGKRQIKSPKLYISDSGLLASMIGADRQRVASDGGLAGALVETFVATELERQASWAPKPVSFWHYREQDREVDIIAERPSGEVVGVEVKSGATVRARDFAGLIQIRDQLGTRFRAGAVLHSGERTLPFGDRLWAIPLAALWSGSRMSGL